MSDEKAALRRRFRALRADVPERVGADAALVARVLALPEVVAAQTVLAFWPLLHRGEVDVRPLVAALQDRGTTVALPVVVPGEAPRLMARVATGALVDGPWGLREPPPDAPEVPPAALDLVVVPALALGRDGSRLGYGGGYYDVFLATTPALRVGVVRHAGLVAALPAEAHDARVDVVVTEHETVRVSGDTEGRVRNGVTPAP
ncbi:MAG TPA: 5-formyltetrahydrofolate cyclo-ligase [Rubricoccaceae bacterium]